jgi:hypothetical protein
MNQSIIDYFLPASTSPGDDPELRSGTKCQSLTKTRPVFAQRSRRGILVRLLRLLRGFEGQEGVCTLF